MNEDLKKKITTTAVLDKDENLLRSVLQWHRSCHSNVKTPFPILLTAVQLFSKITGTSSFNSRLDVCKVKAKSVRGLLRYFGMKFLWLEIWQNWLDYLDVRPFSVGVLFPSFIFSWTTIYISAYFKCTVSYCCSHVNEKTLERLSLVNKKFLTKKLANFSPHFTGSQYINTTVNLENLKFLKQSIERFKNYSLTC